MTAKNLKLKLSILKRRRKTRILIRIFSMTRTTKRRSLLRKKRTMKKARTRAKRKAKLCWNERRRRESVAER